MTETQTQDQCECLQETWRLSGHLCARYHPIFPRLIEVPEAESLICGGKSTLSIERATGVCRETLLVLPLQEMEQASKVL